jgi:hypothetical protein
MLGWVDALHMPEKWDFLIANVGHHSAAGAEHWTLGEYRSHVKAFFDAMRLRMEQQTKGKFIWMASHAMPLSRDNQIIDSNDWRTNQRLALYEKFARDSFMDIQKQLGVDRVMYQDPFNMTLPMIEAVGGDCGHFKSANVQLALVQQFLNLVCPSRDENATP